MIQTQDLAYQQTEPARETAVGSLTPVRVGVILAFCAGILAYIITSWHWPLIWDMQVIHYVSFLIDRGWAPYRQIGDMNMPGAYLVEGWALHFFGSSDLGWRLYDFTLSGVLIAAMIAIARRYDWLAGLVAGGTFMLTHGAEGPRNAGQRDQVMAVALMAGYAFCFEALRRRKTWPMLFFGLAVALAAAIKPTLALAGPLLLALAVVELRREKVPVGRYVLWSLGGFAAVAVIVVGFLLRHGSMRAFIFLFTGIFPHYLTLAEASWPHLLKTTLQPPILLYFLCAVAVAFLHRAWRNWEQRALLLGIALGAINYYGQRKGFFQHRYTMTVFVVLWASIQIFLALRARGPARWIASGGLAMIVLFYVPRNVYWMRTWPSHDEFSATLERDLEILGPQRLQNNVQCLDIVDGCLNALYHLKIVQSTGSTGDLLLFQPVDSPIVEAAREAFANTIRSNPPAVFVLGNWQFGAHRTFHKIEAWPAFASFLKGQYIEVNERQFREPNAPASQGGPGSNDAAYRIYIQRGSPLVDAIPAMRRATSPV